MRLIMTETSWDTVALAQDLTTLGCRVSLAADEGDMSQFLVFGSVHGLIVDGDLPDLEAAFLIRTARAKHPMLPILVIDRKRDKALRTKAYRAGADVVVDPTVEPVEIAARLWAMSLRIAGFSTPSVTAQGVTLDLLKRRAHVGDVRVPLSRREFELVEILALAGGAPVSTDVLMETIYAGAEDEPVSKVVATFFCNIRRKIAEAGGARGAIETVSGFGYRFAVDRPGCEVELHGAEMERKAA